MTTIAAMLSTQIRAAITIAAAHYFPEIRTAGGAAGAADAVFCLGCDFCCGCGFEPTAAGFDVVGAAGLAATGAAGLATTGVVFTTGGFADTWFTA